MKQNDFGSRNRPETLETASQQVHRERMERLVKRMERSNKKRSKKFQVGLRQALNRNPAPKPKSILARVKQKFIGWKRRTFS
jgi:hypothetical protein